MKQNTAGREGASTGSGSSQKHYLFGEMPVLKALLTLAVPTILSQIVTMIYNLADTYFVGRSNDPLKVAAVSAAYVLLFFMNAFSNLFGIGGGSLISRLLGMHKEEEAKKAAAFSFWGSAALGVVYILAVLLFEKPLLYFLGASESTYAYCREYVRWVVLFGGVPTVVSLTLAHLLRNEGHASTASAGLTAGGLLNMVLDPLFMFVLLPEGQEVTGAAAATFISNVFVLVFFLFSIRRMKENTVISLSLRTGLPEKKNIREIFGIGFPSTVATGLAAFSNMFVTHTCAATELGDYCVAAAGIVKKIDMLPMNTGMGLCQGMIPLVAYNYAAKNYDRMKKAMKTARGIGILFALVCVVCYELFAEPITGLFIQEAQTAALSARLLRLAVLATPTTITSFQLNYSFQATAHGKETMLLSVARQGVFHIPLIALFASLWGAEGIMLAQLASDALTLSLGFTLWHYRVEKKLP